MLHDTTTTDTVRFVNLPLLEPTLAPMTVAKIWFLHARPSFDSNILWCELSQPLSFFKNRPLITNNLIIWPIRVAYISSNNLYGKSNRNISSANQSALPSEKPFNENRLINWWIIYGCVLITCKALMPESVGYPKSHKSFLSQMGDWHLLGVIIDPGYRMQRPFPVGQLVLRLLSPLLHFWLTR